MHDHDGLLHQGTELFLPSLERIHLGLRHDHPGLPN
jgi:hypothetical protein